jgi:hypothetical protein
LRTANISANGRTIKCMETAKLSGTMEKYTKESMKMTKSMVSVHLVGLTSENMSANGNKESNMVKENTTCLTGAKNLDNGSRVKG